MKKIIMLCSLLFIANTTQSFVFDDLAEENQDLQRRQNEAKLAYENTEKYKDLVQYRSDIETARERMSELSTECFQNSIRCSEFNRARRDYLALERSSVRQRQIAEKEAEARQTKEYADYEGCRSY